MGNTTEYLTVTISREKLTPMTRSGYDYEYHGISYTSKVWMSTVDIVKMDPKSGPRFCCHFDDQIEI